MSLRETAVAAGQSNAHVVQYHSGDKASQLTAIQVLWLIHICLASGGQCYDLSQLGFTSGEFYVGLVLRHYSFAKQTTVREADIIVLADKSASASGLMLLTDTSTIFITFNVAKRSGDGNSE